MCRVWSPEELIESWTLLGTDWTLVGKSSASAEMSRPKVPTMPMARRCSIRAS
jgi:hypothetical protein